MLNNNIINRLGDYTMRYATSDLRKMQLPLTEESEIDFSNDLIGLEDILSCSKAKVVETISKQDTFYKVDASIKINLVIESAISLKEVPYEIVTNVTFLYTFDKDDVSEFDAILIENGVVDTYDAILTEILCNKPMTVCLPGEEYKNDDDDKDNINPAFASLADLLKK